MQKFYTGRNKDKMIFELSIILMNTRKLAQEFKDQLTIGTPTEDDEKALRKLSQQLKDKKVVVKLHLRYTLHAKLYLAFSVNLQTWLHRHLSLYDQTTSS